jgi:putative copper resistance protein D
VALTLISVRIVHFASTIVVAGVFIFLFYVGEPAFGAGTDRVSPQIALLRRKLLKMAWLGLTLSIASGAAWLLLLSADITGSPLVQVLSDGSAEAVVRNTQFGRDWEARFVLSIPLVTALGSRVRSPLALSRSQGLLVAAVAASFLGALVWAGHSGAAPGMTGRLQITADFLHLVAAGAWLGGLLPLALVLSTAERSPAPPWAAIARDATLRYSTLGMTAVGTLVATGAVNTWALVGGVSPLVETLYGRVLLLKIAIFLSMFAVAAINRLLWTPRLLEATSTESGDYIQVLHHLKRNSLIEAGLGVALLAVVGALGTMAPAAMMSHSS